MSMPSSWDQRPIRPRRVRSALEVAESHKVWYKGPQFRPSGVVCACCKEPGHHVVNCAKAIEDRIAKSLVHCVKGYHFPYLHGVWRCNNCGMHLDDEEMARQLPDFRCREAAKDWAKVEKYGSPLTRWQ